MFTPFSLQFLFHCYAVREPFQDPPSGALNEVIYNFSEAGLIYKDQPEDNYYCLTFIGKQFADHILKLRVPPLFK